MKWSCCEALCNLKIICIFTNNLSSSFTEGAIFFFFFIKLNPLFYLSCFQNYLLRRHYYKEVFFREMCLSALSGDDVTLSVTPQASCDCAPAIAVTVENARIPWFVFVGFGSPSHWIHSVFSWRENSPGFVFLTHHWEKTHHKPSWASLLWRAAKPWQCTDHVERKMEML